MLGGAGSVGGAGGSGIVESAFPASAVQANRPRSAEASERGMATFSLTVPLAAVGEMNRPSISPKPLSDPAKLPSTMGMALLICLVMEPAENVSVFKSVRVTPTNVIAAPSSETTR